MKKNIKSVILIVILAFAFALTSCKFFDNNQPKTKKQNTNTPATNPSGEVPEDPELELDSCELPLTLEAITAGRIILSGKDSFERISIQKGNGLIFDCADNIDVQPGDKIRFYGSNYKSDGSVNLTISCTADFYVYGNAMSLLYYTDFTDKTEITDDYALQKLFLNNTHIKNHETLDIVLPATTLSEGCYKKMFYGCTGITRAPELPAATLTKECYNYMFLGCESLNYIKCLATDISATDCTKNWLANVSPTGTFVQTQNNNIWKVKDNYSGIPRHWTIEPPCEVVNAYQLPLTLEALADGTITLINIDGVKNLKYTKNGNDKIAANSLINVYEGDIVSFYAEGIEHEYAYDQNGNRLKPSNSLNIRCSSSCYVYGNVMSLISPDAFADAKVIPEPYAFYQLFKGTSQDGNLIKNCSIDLVLPATTLTEGCYNEMFYYCTILTQAPELPATKMGKSCYEGMFWNCTNLTVAPELPATELAERCYATMFSSCSNLTVAPKLPATSLAEECYRYMFYRCGNLIVPPELPATTLAKNCYYYMFDQCSYLTMAPKLPATELAEGCYQGMFASCKKITVAPELPATTLADYCYAKMFDSCFHLITAPELPATTLAKNCYDSMFLKCECLITAPELPATELAPDCYDNMFSDCSKLAYIKCLAEKIADDWVNGDTPPTFQDCFTNWLQNIQSSGLLLYPNYLGVSIIPYPVNWNAEKDFPLTLEIIKDGAITIKNPDEFTNLKYSRNHGERTDVPETIDVLAGDIIWFFADGPANDDDKYLNIDCSSDCYIYGNIMSLISANTGYSNKEELSMEKTFNSLFKDNKHILNHPVNKLLLPAKDLTGANSCYCMMFYDCDSLTAAPELPATALADSCYAYMFAYCDRLVYVPDLEAKQLTEKCYNRMFFDCSKLTTPPQIAATQLAPSCFESMFELCSYLSSAPVLACQTLEEKCYSCMFKQCMRLTAAPELPAGNLAVSCYECMFQSCWSLIKAPDLPATILADNCYSGMFDSCTSLTSAPELNAETLTPNCYYQMFSGCKKLQSAPKLESTSISSNCYYEMFKDCSSLTKAPELPATDLADYCYFAMFAGCIALTEAPELKAKTLKTNCYNWMFKDCLNITSVTCLATDVSAEKCTREWLKNVSLNGTFTKDSSMTNWENNSTSGIPKGWTVEVAQ